MNDGTLQLKLPLWTPKNLSWMSAVNLWHCVDTWLLSKQIRLLHELCDIIVLVGVDWVGGVVLDSPDCTIHTPINVFCSDELWELRVDLGELVTLLTDDQSLLQRLYWRLLSVVLLLPNWRWGISPWRDLGEAACRATSPSVGDFFQTPRKPHSIAIIFQQSVDKDAFHGVFIIRLMAS